MRPVRQLKPWKVGADQPDAEAGGDQVLEVPAGEPFVADDGPPGPQRIGAAGVREQCGGYFAFPDLSAGLETSWETALQAVAEAQAELARRQALRPKTLTSAERAAILALGDDLHQVWDAPATTDKDRKQLLHTLAG